RSSALNASIELILLRRYNPKITPPVIQPVAVYVVNMHIRRRLHDFTMHQYRCAFSVDCDLSLCISIAIATPLVLTQPLEILIIYDRNFSPSKRALLRHLSPLPEIQTRRVNLRPLVAFGNKCRFTRRFFYQPGRKLSEALPADSLFKLSNRF